MNAEAAMSLSRLSHLRAFLLGSTGLFALMRGFPDAFEHRFVDVANSRWMIWHPFKGWREGEKITGAEHLASALAR